MLHNQIKSLAEDVRDLEGKYSRLVMVAKWVITAHDDPENAPQSLAFQIKQMKEVLGLTIGDEK